jgi:uncharacterized surface protein with fasciclin (FAS1) repeats
MKPTILLSAVALWTTALVTRNIAEVRAERRDHRVGETSQWDREPQLDERDDRFLKVASDDYYVGKGKGSKSKSSKGKNSKGKGKGMKSMKEKEGKGKMKEKGGKGGDKSSKDGMNKHGPESDKKMKKKEKEDSAKSHDHGHNDEDDYGSNDEEDMPEKSGKNGIGMMKEDKKEASMKKLGKGKGGKGKGIDCGSSKGSSKGKGKGKGKKGSSKGKGKGKGEKGSSKGKGKGKRRRNLKTGPHECDTDSPRATDEPTPSMILDTPRPTPLIDTFVPTTTSAPSPPIIIDTPFPTDERGPGTPAPTPLVSVIDTMPPAVVVPTTTAPTPVVTGPGTSSPTVVDGTAPPTSALAAPTGMPSFADTAEPTGSVGTAAPAGATGTIVDVISDIPELSTLVSALDVANLTGALASPDQVLTLFAPLNVAFDALPKDYLPLLLEDPWTLHLQNLLQYHVTGESIVTSDITDGQAFAMLNGETVTISLQGANIILLNGDNAPNAQLVAADIPADNGVVQAINGVLLPGYIFRNVTDLGDQYSQFLELLDITDLDLLLEEFGPWTVFAPTNDAFNELPEDQLNFLLDPANFNALTQTIGSHIVQGVGPTVNLEDGQVIESAQGPTLTISIPGGDVTDIFVNDALIVEPNILAFNGVVHGINKVLITAP